MAELIQQIREEFSKSRKGAISRCISIVLHSGRKDLAKQIFNTTQIEEAKNKNTPKG